MGKIRPIMVKGHERPLTMVKYNREGDLLFTCAKDHTPCLWYAENGERIGTYSGTAARCGRSTSTSRRRACSPARPTTRASCGT